jgi:hypothetical protein
MMGSQLPAGLRFNRECAALDVAAQQVREAQSRSAILRRC